MMRCFDYRCNKCGFVKEERVKDLEQVVICTECEEQMERLFSAPPFILRGAGWAKDNYGLK